MSSVQNTKIRIRKRVEIEKFSGAEQNTNKFEKTFRTVVHYAQEVNSKQFSAYDHGQKENQASPQVLLG